METLAPLNPSSIIKEALKLLRASLPTTIVIQQEIDPYCGTIIGNLTNMHQLVVNLCTNALHAMADEKGVLTVKLSRVVLMPKDLNSQENIAPGPFVELKVSDTGSGMDQKTIERIFEPYFTTKDSGKGSGMGLALVHGIVHHSGGFIKVESEPGRGSTFHVFFPAIAEDPILKAEEEKTGPIPKGSERILAVDDEEDIVGMYKAVLEHQGYHVTAFSNSEKAFEEIQRSPDDFDLIITDQTMPNLSGAELTRKTLEIRPDIPIILCTGYSSMISEDEAKKIGITRFMMKPVNRRDLAFTVRKILDKQKTVSV